MRRVVFEKESLFSACLRRTINLFPSQKNMRW